MAFLDPGRIRGWHAQTEVGLALEFPAAVSRQCDGDQPHGACSLDRSEHVRRVATGGEPDRHIPGAPEPLDLAQEDVLETIIVADAGQDRGIGGEREGRKGAAFVRESPDHFGGQVLGIRGAAAIAEEKHGVAPRQRLHDRFHGFENGFGLLVRKPHLDSGAFAQDFAQGIRGHRSTIGTKGLSLSGIGILGRDIPASAQRKMKLTLPDFDGFRILVAGDLMLDRYWLGATERISPEAPVPVVHVNATEERPGGAGNVALNLSALGIVPALVGATGEDEAGWRLDQLLTEAGVDCHFQRRPGAATITKLRVISRNQQLIRLDFEDGFPGLEAADLLPLYQPLLQGSSVVVLSDYAKGALRAPDRLIQAAREAGVPVLVDPKGRDFARYRGAHLITPNFSEFEAVAGPCADADELVRRGEALLNDCGIAALLVTRGAEGMSLIRPGQAPLHLPARAREVFDVTGAGDTVIALLAAGIAAGLELPQATALANLAAGIVVGKLGTATVSVAEMRRQLREQDDASHGVVDEETLMTTVADARAHGERIVMTNGCFDLLHAGHVAYLEQARARGDRLVVAVNDDDSVRRLKGESRPVNPLAQRMAVLAGLASVDWVVPFSEDTPARLIGRVLPDVLVKGGDYRPTDIAGYDAVVASGGSVEILDFLDGCSTSAMLERLRAGS